MSHPHFLTPRRLPLVVPPYHRETTLSYITRLAEANKLDSAALRRYLSASERSVIATSAERLAAVTGHAEATLLLALPDLGRPYPAEPLRHQRRACLHCQLARGAQGWVECWLPREEVVCLRHLRWLEGSGYPHRQPMLTEQPSIVRANLQHRRLVRRYGFHDVNLGFVIAERIVREWHRHYSFEYDFLRHMAIFHGPNWRVSRDDPTVFASEYPQIIALARLIATPHWRSLALDDRGRDRFFDELIRTVAPTYIWDAHTWNYKWDPVIKWIIEELEIAHDPRERQLLGRHWQSTSRRRTFRARRGPPIRRPFHDRSPASVRHKLAFQRCAPTSMRRRSLHVSLKLASPRSRNMPCANFNETGQWPSWLTATEAALRKLTRRAHWAQ
jgi:hypothetical protein